MDIFWNICTRKSLEHSEKSFSKQGRKALNGIFHILLGKTPCKRTYAQHGATKVLLIILKYRPVRKIRQRTSPGTSVPGRAISMFLVGASSNCSVSLAVSQLTVGCYLGLPHSPINTNLHKVLTLGHHCFSPDCQYFFQ